MPSIGVPGSRALGDELVEPALADPLHRPREGADPGQDHAVGGPRGSSASAVICALGADPLERLLDRAQVAHPVVEDR